MRRRYINYMNDVQPSRAFVSQLENEMNRELRRKSHRQKTMPMALTAAASVIMIIIALFAVLPARYKTDIVSQPKAFTSAPTLVPSAVPTAEPTDVPTPEPTVEPAAAVSYPPEDVRLELEMGDQKLHTNHNILWDPENILINEKNLIGVSGSPLIEIHQSAELNSVVMAPLRPGDAYWPVKNADALMQLTDAKGNAVGYTELVQYYDEELNTVKEGWKHTLYDSAPPEVTEIPVPVESLLLPGIVRADNTLLRYGKNANAPAVAALQKDQPVALAYRVGNWIYASTEPVCFGYEMPVTGWLHISEVIGASWHTPLNQVDLLADSVNLRDQPDGKIIGSVDKESLILYAGDTLPGKNGDWHFVSVNWFTKGSQDGYISADYAKLHVFPLESELNMDGVVSATLRRPGNDFTPQEQTISGDKLSLLLERLRSARSESVYTTVCAEGSATITLTYDDNSEVVLPISGDGCTQVRYGDVTYDLKTDEERVVRFLEAGGAGQIEILGPIFDQIDFY